MAEFEHAPMKKSTTTSSYKNERLGNWDALSLCEKHFTLKIDLKICNKGGSIFRHDPPDVVEAKAEARSGDWAAAVAGAAAGVPSSFGAMADGADELGVTVTLAGGGLGVEATFGVDAREGGAAGALGVTDAPWIKFEFGGRFEKLVWSFS